MLLPTFEPTRPIPLTTSRHGNLPPQIRLRAVDSKRLTTNSHPNKFQKNSFSAATGEVGLSSLCAIPLRTSANKLLYLRSTIGLVQQEAFLFSMSLADNIKFGKPDDADADANPMLGAA